MRLAAALLGEDLDALEEVTDGFAGTVKCQVAGPWTLAAAVELRTGERMLRDPVAVGDLAQALAAAVADHVAEVRRRMPGAAAVVVQLDEPSLAAVLAGRIGTASGLSTYAAVGEQVATGVLRTVVDAIHAVDALGVVHCCAGDPPVDIVRAAAVDGVSVDLTAIGDGVDEEIGRLLDARGTLLAGSVPALPVERLGDARASAPVRSLLDRLGMAGEEWLPQIVVTPTCGLAGAPPAWPRTALAACAAVGRVLRNDHGEDEAPSR
jgi:methionine synthase II (cobalamin-independent)